MAGIFWKRDFKIRKLRNGTFRLQSVGISQRSAVQNSDSPQNGNPQKDDKGDDASTDYGIFPQGHQNGKYPPEYQDWSKRGQNVEPKRPQINRLRLGILKNNKKWVPFNIN